LRVRFLILVALLGLALGGVVFSACGGDDNGGGGVSVLSPKAESDPEAGSDPEAEPDPQADPEAGSATPATPATPAPKPEAAAQVDVTLQEWAVVPGATTAPAGEVYFLVTNEGPDEAHEFVVARTDLAPDALPVEAGKVSEDEVDIVGEIEPFAPGSTASITLELAAGSYVLLCNIAEQAGAEVESHYELGMRTAFVVE